MSNHRRSTTTSLRSTLAVAVAAITAGTASAAFAAEAPVVSDQQVYRGATAPLTIPGTGVRKGDKLPAGAKLVFRTVTVEGEQEPRFTMRAPSGLKLRGLAPQQGVGFAVVPKGNYAGRTSVQVRAYAATKGAEEATARIYALAR